MGVPGGSENIICRGSGQQRLCEALDIPGMVVTDAADEEGGPKPEGVAVSDGLES